MKAKILAMLILFSMKGFSQDTLEIPKLRSQLFSLSPISKKVNEVNGLVFGIGHIDNKRIASQKINGINIEVNPAPAAGALVAFISLMYLPEIIEKNKVSDSLKNTEDYYKIKDMKHTPNLKLNGLNISSGCFFTTTSMNGLNISVGNKFKDFNGTSITALGTIASSQNGFSMGIYNRNNNLTGSSVGLYNQSYDLKGVHIGLINRTRKNNGLQIGVFNQSNSKGLQLGVWNVNNKRSLPFFNW